jgi:DNA-binding MarR family transcriptional regulator
MAQEEVIHLETSLGYLLKETASALRTAMEDVLRPLGMNITHYSCLELLAQRPGLSNSDLARGAFVSRQSMNVLLQSMERDGFVKRAEEAPTGRALPTQLTEAGRKRLAVASAAVRGVEVRMNSNLDASEQDRLRELLARCAASLRAPAASPASTGH